MYSSLSNFIAAISPPRVMTTSDLSSDIMLMHTTWDTVSAIERLAVDVNIASGECGDALGE